MFYYKNLRELTVAEIYNQGDTGQTSEVLAALLELIPDDDQVLIAIPRHTADELCKYINCYAPLLRQVAQACVDVSGNRSSSVEENKPIPKLDSTDLVKRLRILGEVAETSEGGLIVGSNGDFRKAADEIDRLNTLLSSLVDTDDELSVATHAGPRERWEQARDAFSSAMKELREAVGR